MDVDIYKVNTPHKNDIRIRMNPKFDSQVVGFIDYGTPVKIQHIREGWGYVSIHGIDGWVYMRYMKKRPNWNIFKRKGKDNG